ncbi:unnamed protein product [Heligmosomoides polygyrus]|uniref:RNA-directed DNA polymerase from transposon BS n=1 Tax=Heligmosomoides polygyrus TaxID=6339 RepID=A0A183GS38_HELPZ|nr:unnamed protein product [Heligmosomoides polygyrus]
MGRTNEKTPPLHAAYDSGGELVLGTCDSRGVGGVGVLVNTHLAMNIDSYESPLSPSSTRDQTTASFAQGSAFRVKERRPRSSRRGIPERPSTGISAFRAGREGPKFKKRNPRTTINWDLYTSLAGLWEDTVIDNIDEEYDHFVHHLCDSATRAESLKNTKRRNYQLTSELAKLCRAAIKEDLKERRAEVLAKAAEAGLSIRKARQKIANFKTKMTALRRPDGTVTSSRRAMEKVIHDFHSDLFDSHIHLPHAIFRRMDTSFPLFSLPIRHAISSVKKRTAPGPDRIRLEHLKNLPLTLINTLTRLFTRYLSECKVPSQWKTSRTVLLYKKGDVHDIGNSSKCRESTSCRCALRLST